MSDLRHVSTSTRRVVPTLTPIALAILLGACQAEGPGGDGATTPSSGTIADTGAPPSAPSSAAQLADDQTTTLRDAIALASGDEITLARSPAPTPAPSGVPDSGAATPAVDPDTTPDTIVTHPLDVLPEPTSAPPVQAPAARPEAAPRPTDVDTATAPISIPSAEASAPGSAEPSSGPASGTVTTPVATDGQEAEAGKTDIPKAAPAPISDADPVSEADPELASEPGAESAAEPVSAPKVELDPEPAGVTPPEPAPGETSAPAPEKTPEPETRETSESAPEPTSEPVAGRSADAAPDAGGDEERARVFTSARTAGFRGELRDDDSVRITWPGDPSHRGYNVYRQSEFLTSVSTPELIEEELPDGDYYYEIQAYHYDDGIPQNYVAKGLTVQVRGTGRTDPDAPVPNQDLLDGYDLVFADEFDTGVLDATKWNTAFLWGPKLTINSEVQYYVDILREPDFGFDPFTFEDGHLVINSIRTPDHLLEKTRGHDGKTKDYLSGIITSYESMQFTYGYAEIRARMPYGKGYWPAFWLLNAKYDGPNPEIDIMEFIGDNEDTVYHTYHYYDQDGVLRSTHSEPTKGRDFTAGFHTYGADWRPGLIVYYVDGVEVHRVSDPEVSRQDMYLLANTAMGGWWAGPPDDTTPLPGRYEIDYVRVYRQTAPYETPPLSDQPSRLAPATEVPGASPGHRPPFELWPEGYPGRF